MSYRPYATMLATVRLACIKAAEGMSPVRRALSNADMAAGVEKLYGERHRRLE